MKKAMILAVALTGCGYSVDDSKAIEAMSSMGFTEATVTERYVVVPSLYGCGQDDSVAFDVSATSQAKQRVSMVVCCGAVFKGCTVRTR